MKDKLYFQLLLVALATAMTTVHAQGMQVVSDTAVDGFLFPESAACDPAGKAVYVSQFVSALKPADKDGKGRISKVGIDGKMIDAQFLPGPGDVLNKPKGLWVEGERLWVTDFLSPPLPSSLFTLVGECALLCADDRTSWVTANSYCQTRCGLRSRVGATGLPWHRVRCCLLAA